MITGVVPADNGDTDPDNSTEGRLFDDILSAVLAGDGTTTLGGTITLNEDGSFTYTPPAGGSGVDSFTYYVNDGYDNSNTVTVTINVGTPQSTPVPAIHKLEYPVLSGCPAEMDAAAAELAVNSDQLQMMIANSMATNPNMQPCDACANLLTAAAALRGINEETLAAMNMIFNSYAPSGAPFTPEALASITTAFADFRDSDPRLALMTDEEYAEYQQYAMADELVEAFVSDVAVLENDLKLTASDPIALVMDKYGEAIEATGNPNISTYLIEQMEAARTPIESVVASAD